MEIKTVDSIRIQCGSCVHFESSGYDNLTESYTGSCKHLYNHLAQLNNSHILSRKFDSINVFVDFACTLWEGTPITF